MAIGQSSIFQGFRAERPDGIALALWRLASPPRRPKADGRDALSRCACARFAFLRLEITHAHSFRTRSDGSRRRRLSSGRRVRGHVGWGWVHESAVRSGQRGQGLRAFAQWGGRAERPDAELRHQRLQHQRLQHQRLERRRRRARRDLRAERALSRDHELRELLLRTELLVLHVVLVQRHPRPERAAPLLGQLPVSQAVA